MQTLIRRIGSRIRRGAARPFKRIRNRATRSGPKFERLWGQGIDSEIRFWSDYLATRGGNWHEEYAFRTDPEAPLQERLLNLLPDRRRVSILDVGAGPLTRIGKVWPGHDLVIRAVDALADEYKRLLREADVTPPVATELCRSEDLAEMFKPDSFDLVTGINTLDHSYDPLTAIRQMATIGSVVYLEHHPNEAEAQGYEGLHQWNFDIVGDTCLLWRPGVKHDLGAELAPLVVCGDKTLGHAQDDDLNCINIRRPDARPMQLVRS